MVIGLWRRNRRTKTFIDQLTGQLDATRAGAVREKAVIPDADQPGRQHMQKEAAKELVDVQGKQLLGVAVCVVAIAEADTLTVEGDDPGVADGDAVGVVGQIAEDLLRPAEGRLAVDDPIGRTGLSQKQVEGDGVGEHPLGQLERPLTPRLAQGPRQQRAKATREHHDRKEEGGLGSGTPLPARNREAAARHHAMDVRMERQRLSLGVKHAQAAGLDLESAVSNVDECSTCGSEQQVVEDARGMQSKDVEPLGHGEDHVEIGHGKQLGTASLEPSSASRGAAARTGAIAAGVPLNVLVTALVTLLPLPAEGGRAACADRTQGFTLCGRGPVGAQERLASSSYDRAEIGLGGHASLARALDGGTQNMVERTGHVAQRRG